MKKEWLQKFILFFPFITAVAPALVITLILNAMIVLQLIKRFRRTRNRTLALAFLLMWLASLVLLSPQYYSWLRYGTTDQRILTRSLREKLVPLMNNSYGFVNAAIVLVLIRPFQKPFKVIVMAIRNALRRSPC